MLLHQLCVVGVHLSNEPLSNQCELIHYFLMPSSAVYHATFEHTACYSSESCAMPRVCFLETLCKCMTGTATHNRLWAVWYYSRLFVKSMPTGVIFSFLPTTGSYSRLTWARSMARPKSLSGCFIKYWSKGPSNAM